MEKKIKVKEVIARILDNVPIKCIKFQGIEYNWWLSRNTYINDESSECLDLFQILDDEVEIVEKNKKEEINIQDIEEIKEENIFNCTDENYRGLAYQYNKIVKALKQLDKKE